MPAPPSVQAILRALEGQRRMTGIELLRATGLSRRTASAAIRFLRIRGLLLQRPTLRDTRHSYFWLAAAAKC